MSMIRKRVRELLAAEREQYETLAERFESACDDPSRCDRADRLIEELLPPSGPVRTLLLVHCIQCELDSGRDRKELGVGLAEYFARFPELASDPDAPIELAQCEYPFAQADGISLDDFVARFPSLSPALREALADREPAKPWTPPLEYEVDPILLGRGGWGVVYKAVHKRLGRTEAIKAVDAQSAQGASGRTLRSRVQRLRQEIPIAARLNHENIVHLYSDGEHLGQPYFVMEYCPGGNLKVRLTRGAMKPAEAASLVRELAVAVHHVHVFRLIDRDLKPSNILFGDSDVPKVADFGLALRQDECDRLHDIVGTPEYMAPEQIEPDRGLATPATDVYGLGAILHECLTTKPPFLGENAQELRRRVCNDPPPSTRAIDRRVPSDLDRVCRKCLAKAQADRYPDAQSLADDLDRFLTGVPVCGVKKSPILQPPNRLAMHWIRSNARIVSAVAIVAMLAAACGIAVDMERAAALQRDVQDADDGDPQAGGNHRARQRCGRARGARESAPDLRSLRCRRPSSAAESPAAGPVPGPWHGHDR